MRSKETVACLVEVFVHIPDSQIKDLIQMSVVLFCMLCSKQLTIRIIATSEEEPKEKITGLGDNVSIHCYTYIAVGFMLRS